ncbi:iron ABC transporter substrate-binding protein [Acidothermaceae bacterium B102]|nr:iron ABC transporter substrate-binding protein [Acidothermaceae bacterium B102]
MTFPPRRPTAATLVRLGASAAALTVLTACGGSSSSAGASSSAGPYAGVSLTLYNGQHEQTTNALVAGFEKLTGATVKVRSDDEDVLAQQIEQEGSHSPADAFYTENTPPLARLDEKGLLSPVDAATLAAVPSAYNAADKTWVGVSARVSELVYNTTALTPADLPTSILDLADPKWKGKLDIAPSETDFQPLVTAVAADKGDAAAVAWLKALKTNAGKHTDPDNETLVANVNKGITEIGVINHYYWYRLQLENGASGTHSALHPFAAHDDGYLLDVSGAAVMKSSKHQAAAQALLSYLVGTGGQTVLADGDSFEYPVGSHVAPSSKLPPFAGLEPKSFDLSQIGDGAKAVRLLQQAGLL